MSGALWRQDQNERASGGTQWLLCWMSLSSAMHRTTLSLDVHLCRSIPDLVLACQSDPRVIFFQIKGGRPDLAELGQAAAGRAQKLS
jgi:hypothetical protein